MSQRVLYDVLVLIAYDDDYFPFETGSRVILLIVEEKLYIFLVFVVCRLKRCI